jgi:hypothetical protein
MDAIENLFSLDYPTIIMGVFIIILGVDKIVFLLVKAKKALRIKFGYEEDKETIEDRITTLEKHDNWQYKEITKMSKGIENIESELLDNNLERKRKYILDFCSSLSNGQKQNKEAFNNVFKTYKNYEKLLSEHNMENGQAEESMKFISEKYQELLRNGGL